MCSKHFLTELAGNVGISEVACPAGKTAEITAFPDDFCRDAGVSAGELPKGRLLGACKEIVIEAEDGTVSEGGQSARLICV